MELLYTGKPVFFEGTYTSEADYFKATFEVDYVQLVLYTQDFIKARFQNAPEDCQWLEDLIDKLGNKDLTTSCSHSLPTARLCFDDYTSEQRIERLLSCRTASTQEPIFSTTGRSRLTVYYVYGGVFFVNWSVSLS